MKGFIITIRPWALVVIGSTILLTGCQDEKSEKTIETPSISAGTQKFVGYEDSPLSGQLTSQGTNLTYSVAAQAMHGQVSLHANGDFTYIPAANFNGIDYFFFNVKTVDGDQDTGVTELNITAINDLPSLNHIQAFAYPGSPLELQLHATDIDGDKLTYSLVTPPSMGMASVSADGKVYYQPSLHSSGNENLQIQIDDGYGSTNSEITISVATSSLTFGNGSYAAEAESGSISRIILPIQNMGMESVITSIVSTPEWYLPVSDTVMVPAYGSLGFVADIDARTMLAGQNYYGRLQFWSAEPINPYHDINLSLTVINDTTAPGYINDLTVNHLSVFDKVSLNWHAVADSGYSGAPAAGYEIRVSTNPIDESNYAEASVITQNLSPKWPGENENFIVVDLAENTQYYFALRAYDDEYQYSAISNTASIKTLTAPYANVTPQNLDITIIEGQEENYTLTISNNGTTGLEYTTEIIENNSASFARKNSQPQAKQPIQLAPKSLEKSSGKIIVKFNEKTPKKLQSQLATQFNARKIRDLQTGQAQVWKIDAQDEHDFAQKLSNINQQSNVLYAEPDYPLKANYIPNDNLYPQQWALNNEGQTGGASHADINAQEAWNIHYDSSNLIIAVIDTGIDYNHSDLQENIWVNTGEIPGNNIDDDNNGYIDDIHGYNFYARNGNALDDNMHGTHVAGIIGAASNNNYGIAGINHKAKIMAVKFLNSSGNGDTSAAVDSIYYAVNNGAKVLNSSWGGYQYSIALQEAIQYAADNDVLFVAAAGNESNNNDANPMYPASYSVDNIISVAASTDIDSLALFSNYGENTVDISAPGVGILSTVPNEQYEYLDGTSMASPQVAGAAILLRSMQPSLTFQQIKDTLLSSVDLNPNFSATQSGGRLNMLKAMETLPVPFITASPAKGIVSSNSSQSITLAINSLDKLAGSYPVSVILRNNSINAPDLQVNLNITVETDGYAPAAINDLNVTSETSSSAILNFTATGDDGYEGKNAAYDIRYSFSPIDDASFTTANSLLNVEMPTLSGEAVSLYVGNLPANSQIYVAMKTRDSSGMYSALSNVVVLTTLAPPIMSLSSYEIPVQVLPLGEHATSNITVTNIGGDALHVSLLKQASLTVNPAKISSFKNTTNSAPIISITNTTTATTDTFGYTWKSNMDNESVPFHWQDISSTGVNLSSHFRDDNVAGPFEISHTFPFYGINHTQFFISSNGFINFDGNTQNGCCSGRLLPANDGINNLIALAWTDLNITSGGSIYMQSDAFKTIIQWQDYQLYGSINSGITAQMWLYKTGDIELMYLRVPSEIRQKTTTVGIENSDGSDGLQILHGYLDVQDGLAINISAANNWWSINQSTLTLQPGQSSNIEVSFDGSNRDIGSYNANLMIYSNDPNQTEINIPVSMQVLDPL